jgi:hypothetical protein
MKNYTLEMADGSTRSEGQFNSDKDAVAWAVSVLEQHGSDAGEIVVGDWETRNPDSDRRLFWSDAKSADNDSGANAIAQLIVAVNHKQIHTIKVWLENNLEDCWAYSVSDCDDRELARGTVDLDLHAHLDDVVDLVLYELAIDGVTHDDFAKSPEDGGYAIWSR